MTDNSNNSGIPEKRKSGYVTIVGKPNAGKSTLMNVLLNYNLSIVTKKVQTTRNRIMGVLTENNYQIVFNDTPGLLDPKYELQIFMLSEIKSSFEEADIVMNILDVNSYSIEQQIKFDTDFKEELSGKKRIIILNKVDVAPQDKVIEAIGKLNRECGYETIVPVSALENYNIDELKKVLIENLPEGEFFYSEDTMTDRSERFFAAEIIRKNVLKYYSEEIPYSVFVDVEEFKEREGRKDYIGASIVVERESQKIILIGRKGESLKKLGAISRKEIENFLGREIYLNLFVKVRKDWRKDRKFLNNNFRNM